VASRSEEPVSGRGPAGGGASDDDDAHGGLPDAGTPDAATREPHGVEGPRSGFDDPLGPDDGSDEEDEAPLEDIVAEQPLEAIVPLRRPLPLLGTSVAGFAMGMAEVVPGFSGGTVALVAGIYERLVATIRQGARVLSLLVRGRAADAWRAVLAIDWAFAVALAVGMLAALLTLAPVLGELIEERPVEMQAVFIGMVLAAALVASRRLRGSSPWYVLVGIIATVGAFLGLGFSEGTVTEPTLVLLFLGGAVAVCAWILPGVSGSFLLLVMGLYTAVLQALSDRDVLAIAVIALGCLVGLAAFSTLLNWALARAHDLVLSILIGFMVGSVRVLWPWPADEGIGNPELGAPVGGEVFLAAALGLAAFALVWMFGLVSAAVERRRTRRLEAADADADAEVAADEPPPA
jgi:putative membrane protein